MCNVSVAAKSHCPVQKSAVPPRAPEELAALPLVLCVVAHGTTQVP
eukprot:COSAG06_NODE_43872_length_368_cov_0.769517_1_plen_45_part_10